MKYLIAAIALLALGGAARALDLQALENYNSCMDRFAPWQSAGTQQNFNGSDYCWDRYSQDRETNRRLNELENNE